MPKDPNYALYGAFAACLYPFNILSLKILFSALEGFINFKIRVNPNIYPTLKGNYAPVHHEHSYQIESIQGKVPKDCNGVFMKNGPNPRYLSPNGRHHWFEGDGMIHAIRI